MPAVRPVRLRRQLSGFAIDLGLPIALYYLLHLLGVSNLLALGVCAVFPAADVAHQLVTQHAPTGICRMVVVVTVAASIVMSLATHSPRFLLARDGLITGLWGVWFLARRARPPSGSVRLGSSHSWKPAVFSAGSWDALWEK